MTPALLFALGVAAVVSPAAASGGAVARSADGRADLADVLVLVEASPGNTVLTVETVVNADGEYAAVFPLGDVSPPGAPVPTDGARTAEADRLTSPRWVAYSTGCGSGLFGGAREEDAVTSRPVGAVAGDVGEETGGASHVGEARLARGALAQVLSGLRERGYAGAAEELGTDEAGTWLVLEARGPVVRARIDLADIAPAVDLRLLGRGRTGRSDIVVIALSDQPMRLDGVPTGPMKPPASAPLVGLDIRDDYDAWVDDWVRFLGQGGAAGVLEFAGPVTFNGVHRQAVRYRVSTPAGVPGPPAVTLHPDPSLRRHRVRAIVSAGLGAAGALLAGLLLLVGGRARRGRRGGWAVAVSLVGPPAALLLQGCPSLGHLHGATVLPPGESEWTYALSPARDVRHDLNRTAPKAAQNRTPRTLQPEVAWRRGWREGADLAVRANLGGVKGEVRTLVFTQEQVGVNVSAGVGLSGFVHPSYGGVCAERELDAEQDGCFSSLFGGGLVDVPVIVSRVLGGNEFYVGVRGAALLMRGSTTYADPGEAYADVQVTKALVTGITGLLFGASLSVDAYRVTPELQIMLSESPGGNLIFFPIVGVGFTPVALTPAAAVR